MATAPPTHPLTKLTPESTSEKVAGNTSDKQLIGLPYLFHLRQPSKYATPSILGNFLTSKIATAALTIYFLCRVLNRGQTIPSNPDR